MEYLEYTKMIKLEREINSTINPNSIYKDIDLTKDIDMVKSGFYLLDQYYLDDKIKSLRFIYTEKESLFNYKGYFTDNPKEIKLFEELKFKPSNFVEPLNLYMDFFIFEHLIDDDEIINFKFQEDLFTDNGGFNLILSNNKFKQDCINKSFTVSDSLQWKVCSLIQTNNQLGYIEYFNGNYKNSLLPISKHKIGNCILDFKQNIVYLNNKKVKNSLNNPLNNIIISATTFPQCKDYITLKPDNLMIGNRNGYIYLNPIEVPNNIEFKLKVAYNGNIKVEVYLENLNDWVELNQDDNLKASDNKLNLRFKVSTHDEIYKVVLLKA